MNIYMYIYIRQAAIIEDMKKMNEIWYRCTYFRGAHTKAYPRLDIWSDLIWDIEIISHKLKHRIVSVTNGLERAFNSVTIAPHLRKQLQTQTWKSLQVVTYQEHTNKHNTYSGPLLKTKRLATGVLWALLLSPSISIYSYAISSFSHRLTYWSSQIIRWYHSLHSKP